MPLKVTTVGERTYYTKALIYGDPGVGKTTLAATFPDPIFLDFDRGTFTLQEQGGFEHIRVAFPNSFAEGKEFLRDLAKGTVECQTVIIDTMTEMQNRLLVEIARAKHAKEPTVYDEDINTLPDYNKATNAIYQAVWLYRELPKNLVVCTHAREVTDKQTDLFKIQPDLTPRLSNIICGMMDVVGYYFMNDNRKIEAKRVLNVSPTRKLVAKNRLGLPDMIAEPTYQKLNGKKKP